MNGTPRWKLLFILPNLSLQAETPFASESLCICSAADERMQALTDSPGDRTGAQMVTTFRTWFGTPYPSVTVERRHPAPAQIKGFCNVSNCPMTRTTACHAPSGSSRQLA